jgi:chromosome segregation ATPase
MSSQDQQQTWILSLGFKNNISADFKAWIMYNNPDIYSPTKQLSIKYSELNNLKDTHNYEYLKGTIQAPWFKFLHKLQNNTHINIDSNNIQDKHQDKEDQHQDKHQDKEDQHQDKEDQHQDKNEDIDWKLKYHNLLKDTNNYKQQYLKEHKLRKAFNTTITQQRQVINNYIKTENKHKRHIQHITQYLNEIKIREKQTRDELQKSITKIDEYEIYIRECYNTLISAEKEIKIIKKENNSFKQDFKDISSSSLSQQTITQLQQKYETLSFPQYPTIICPITQEIMVEPVIAFDGQSYEKTAIEQWFQSNNKSPSNGTELPCRMLIANHSLRKVITEITTST